MRRGEIWWASLGFPQSSGPGYRRPVLVVQSNEFNESAIRTSICAVIRSNMRLAAAPGNVRVTRRASGLPRDSVVNVSQLITLDKSVLREKVSRLPAESLREVEVGIKLVLAVVKCAPAARLNAYGLASKRRAKRRQADSLVPSSS